MKVKKSGCILINKETKKIGLVCRKRKDDYSFPKGHLEEGETLTECAMRETEEETGRTCIIPNETPVGRLHYTDSQNDETDVYYFLALENGKTKREVKEEDKESLKWVDVNEVEKTLSYQNLKDFWNSIKKEVEKELNND